MEDNTYYSLVPSFEGPKSASESLSSSVSELFPQPCGLPVATSMLSGDQTASVRLQLPQDVALEERACNRRGHRD